MIIGDRNNNKKLGGILGNGSSCKLLLEHVQQLKQSALNRSLRN